MDKIVLKKKGGAKKTETTKEFKDCRVRVRTCKSKERRWQDTSLGK